MDCFPPRWYSKVMESIARSCKRLRCLSYASIPLSQNASVDLNFVSFVVFVNRRPLGFAALLLPSQAGVHSRVVVVSSFDFKPVKRLAI